MFNIEGTGVNVSLDMELDEVVELRDFLVQHLDYIEEIGVDENDEGTITSSSLIQLLASAKRTKPDITIPFIEKSQELRQFGAMKWKLNNE